ncbi:MAG: hypothetical protein SD837_01270 [Candidatus Electrothrix scaldis]|nr:MAG: hypothetical protein SD837_01270 [Candidatus Electrothrix sp. GW3-3]
MDRDLRYLNTDFELMASVDLTPLVEAFGEDALVLYNGKWGKYYKASFESPYDGSSDPNDIISYFNELVTYLNEEEKSLYDSCFSKIFDIGFESGNSKFVCYSELRERTICILADLKARIGVTVYPYAPYPDEHEENVQSGEPRGE